MTRTALALSPHLDDAAFSAGATLHRLARVGWRVVVATLFTGNIARPTGFALECQTSKGIDSHVDYMALRRGEDARACAALGAEPVHLPLLEAPHRGYDSPAALFAAVHPDDSAWADTRDAVAGLLARLSPHRVFAPQAIGAHVDHVIVHEAAHAAGAPLWLWRDWPYHARDPGRQPFAARVRPLRHVPVAPSAADLHAKRAACQAYVSQLGYQFGGPAALDRALEASGPERFAFAPARSGTAPRAGTMPRAS